MLSSTEKQTNVFVESSWRMLLSEFADFFSKFKKIHIWSDGGPQHFKVLKTMGFFANFKKEFGQSIIYNFFVAYHGKSPCDAHAGVMKRAITQAKLENTRIVNETSVEPIVRSLKSTHVLILTTPVSKISKCTLGGGVKRWHKFEYLNEQFVKCFYNSAAKVGFTFSVETTFT